MEHVDKADQCGALVRRCKPCKYKFKKDESVCPECGKPRGHCKNPANGAGGRCYLHGGKSLQGIASPRYVGRGYSKYLPPRMLGDYQDALHDPDLIELRRELALVESRTLDLLKRIDSKEPAQAWRALQEVAAGLGMAIRLNDARGQETAHTALLNLIQEGLTDSTLWGEIGALIESKRRLVETEQKRLVSLKVYVTLEQAALMFDAIVDAVTRHVTDSQTLSAIQADWSGIFRRADRSIVSGGDRQED